MCYGARNVLVPNGTGAVTFRLMVADVGRITGGVVATIDVYDRRTRRIVAKRDLRRSDFVAPQQYQDFRLSFTALRVQALDFRTTFYRAGCYLKLDEVAIR